MILKLGNKIKLDKNGFKNEDKIFRLEEINKINFENEYEITELYDGPSVDIIDTQVISDFIFWVNGIKIEFCKEHLLETEENL